MGILGRTLLVLGLSVAANAPAAAANGGWVCLKDGKPLKVKGKTPKAKKKKCVAKGGTWEKQSTAAVPAPAPEAPAPAPAATGGGGGW